MRQSEFQRKVNAVWEICSPTDHLVTCSPEELVAAYRPHVCVNLTEYNTLNEATYKQIAAMIDPNFLRQGVRASVLRGLRLDKQPRTWTNGRVTPFDPENTMNFLIHSSQEHFQTPEDFDYLNQVQFDDWEEVGNDADLKGPREKALNLLWTGNIRLFCSCPSFLFWGYQEILTRIDASIYPEIRAPLIRNPHRRGVVCKHLHRVLRVLPFYSGDIASEIKQQFGQ